MAGGSGRGNSEIQVIEGDRPDCPRCGGFMKSNGKKDWFCVGCGRTVKKQPKREELDEGGNEFGYDVQKAEERADFIRKRYAAGCKKFVIVSAQNNTNVFRGFWESLLNYCKHNKAELIVIASHYKNHDAWNSDDEKHWCKEVVPYIVHGDLMLGEIVIKASFKINATT